jgi:23S rRNA (cytidine1920-2'-O)/16S rRNA (cytidine1409-2'-O)-methyltransferase
MCGEIFVAGEVSVDPKAIVSSTVDVCQSKLPYVSRGGLKLEYALRTWNIDPTDMVFVDAGSSTGGFTDCLLKHGAAFVHSVDVGYNQLHYRLRSDPRVHVHEKQNIMEIRTLDPLPDAAVADLSFRSITRAASHVLNLTSSRWMIALIKPQFEVPKGQHDFDGVIIDPVLLVRVLENVCRLLWEEGVAIRKIVGSPILGRKGNKEFLALLQPRAMVDAPLSPEHMALTVSGS